MTAAFALTPDQVNKALAGTNTGKTMVRVTPDPGPGPY